MFFERSRKGGLFRERRKIISVFMIRTLMMMVLGAGMAFGQAKFSERLAKIGSYLGEGGVHYTVTDQEGDLKKGAAMLNSLLAMAGEELPFEIDLEAVGADSGIYEVLGSGASSAKKGEYWHNRSFVLTSGKHEGVLSLFGQKASKPITLSFAPEGADIMAEIELDLRQVEQMSRKIAARFGAEAVGAVSEVFEKEIDEKTTVSKLLSGLTVRGALVVWFDDDKQVELMPGMKLPTPHLVARVDRAKAIWDLLEPMIKEDSEIVKKEGEVFYFADAEETPFGAMQPQFIWNEKANQLWFTLSGDSLALSRGEGKKISVDSHFQAASQGLSKETNANGYLSARAIELIRQGAGVAGMMNPEAAPFIQMFDRFLAEAKSPHGYAMTMKVQKDGVLSLVNAPFANKGSSMSGPQSIAAISVLAGLATPQILKAKKNANKVEEINKIRRLLMALGEYDAEFDGYPAELSLLEKEKIFDKGVVSELSAPGLVYRGKEVGNSDKAESSSILLYLEIPDLNKVIFGKADGSVGEVSQKRFQELLAKEKK